MSKANVERTTTSQRLRKYVIFVFIVVLAKTQSRQAQTGRGIMELLL
jgi:hypothetical protein